MSQENVETLRRAVEAWNAGDLARWVSMHHPDVVVLPPDGWPDGATALSREEWLAQAHRLIDSWAEQRIKVTRIHDAGERVVALFEWVTRGKGSQIDLVTDMALIATVRDGLITRTIYYANHAEALEAVGLRA